MQGLFVMSELPWPLHGGRELYAHHLLVQLLKLGHAPRLVLNQAPTPELIANWPLKGDVEFDTLPTSLHTPTGHRLNPHRIWSDFWGWSDAAASAVAAYAQLHSSDYVAAAGLSVLPLLARVSASHRRIWLALDDPCLFQWSLLAAEPSIARRWAIARMAMKMALYERSYRRQADAAIAVSPQDAWALRVIGGYRDVHLMPNGVDVDYFRPTGNAVDPQSLIFWGRLDFQPNLDAIRWFAESVWPVLHARHPGGTWRIVGQNAGKAVRQLIGNASGVELIGAVDDLRPWACRSAVAVIPMRSGAGIKNKLLEAAAMGRPIVASPRAVEGLCGDTAWNVAGDSRQWIEKIEHLWATPMEADDIGARARRWAVEHHSWPGNAELFDAMVRGLCRTSHFHAFDGVSEGVAA